MDEPGSSTPAPRVRRTGSVRPTLRGAGVLAAAVAMVLVAGRHDLPALLPVAGLLLGLLLLGLVVALLAPARVRLTRTAAPRVLDHGETGEAWMRIENRSPVPGLEGTWRDALPGALGGPVDGMLPALARGGAPGGRVDVGYRVMGVRRGRHAAGRMTVLTGDPFGLFERRRHTVQADETVVLPRRVPLPAVPGVAAGGGTSGRPAGRRRGDGTDDVISRTYQPGDAPKRIDWRTSARRGELMVRQDEQAAAQRLGLAVEPGGDAGAVEWAVVAAASVIAHLSAQGHVVTTMVPGRVSRVIAPGRDVLQDALVDLADLTADPGAPIDGEPVDGRPVVAVLGPVGGDRARAWVAALQRADRVVALVAGTSEDETVRVLTAAGWTVVTWRPVDDVADRWASLGREVSGARA